jgi:hypothetical protein
MNELRDFLGVRGLDNFLGSRRFRPNCALTPGGHHGAFGRTSVESGTLRVGETILIVRVGLE